MQAGRERACWFQLRAAGWDTSAASPLDPRGPLPPWVLPLLRRFRVTYSVLWQEARSLLTAHWRSPSLPSPPATACGRGRGHRLRPEPGLPATSGLCPGSRLLGCQHPSLLLLQCATPLRWAPRTPGRPLCRRDWDGARESRPSESSPLSPQSLQICKETRKIGERDPAFPQSCGQDTVTFGCARRAGRGFSSRSPPFPTREPSSSSQREPPWASSPSPSTQLLHGQVSA